MNLSVSTADGETSSSTAAQFVHLHTHSEFSLAEGLLKVKSAVGEATQRHIPAMALTDRNNLFALSSFMRPASPRALSPFSVPSSGSALRDKSPQGAS